MWYHAITDFGDQKRYWWNRRRDDLVKELLMPLLGKQIIVVTRRGRKSLFNFGAVSYATIIKTEEKLSRPAEGKPPKELQTSRFITKHNVTEEFVNRIRLLQSSVVARSLIEQSLSKPIKQIFVIMQFGNKELDSAYEGVIKPVAKEFGFGVLRVDEIQDGGHISMQILDNIAKSELVLGELSGERPNCYYEAGYAHALGKEVILSIRRNDKKHFDLADYRFIEWETEADLRKKLRKRLKAYASRENEES